MSTAPTRLARSKLDLLYTIGVIVKGVDGAFEFVVGIVLLSAPGVAGVVLTAAASEAAEGHDVMRQLVAAYLNNLDVRLQKVGFGFLIVYLLVHGAVKLILVYCLLRKFHRAYPWALAILCAFVLYQFYSIVTHPTAGMIAVTVVDVGIIVLVYREYRVIRAEA